MSLIKAGRCAARANAYEMRPANSWNPSTQRIPVCSGDEEGSREKLVQVDGGRGARQLTVVDQATPRREQLKAGLVSRSAYRVKYSGHTATFSAGPDGVPHIFSGPVDDVVGAGSPRFVYAGIIPETE